MKGLAAGFKPGVELLGLAPIMWGTYIVCALILLARGHGAIMTSATEGKHSRGSRHYVGMAFDLRHRTIAIGERLGILREFREALPGFDVVLEPTHFHIEYDPKR